MDETSRTEPPPEPATGGEAVVVNNDAPQYSSHLESEMMDNESTGWRKMFISKNPGAFCIVGFHFRAVVSTSLEWLFWYRNVFLETILYNMISQFQTFSLSLVTHHSRTKLPLSNHAILPIIDHCRVRHHFWQGSRRGDLWWWLFVDEVSGALTIDSIVWNCSIV